MHMQTSNFDESKMLNTKGQFLDKYDTQFVLKDDFNRLLGTKSNKYDTEMNERSIQIMHK